MTEGNPFQSSPSEDSNDELRLPPLRRSQLAQDMNWVRLWPLAAVVAALVWLATGFYVVGPGQQGVVRQLGQEVNKTGPGLQFHAPWPIEQADVVSVEAIRRIEVGFRTSPQGDVARVNSESLMLTGDENIVEAQVIVQYRVRDASQYLFRLRDPEEALRASTEVALRSVVGGMMIDDVLTVGRAQAQDDTRAFLQRLMDNYEAGILVTDVKLQVVDPPEQVKDAFHEVVRAREDREKLINEARGYTEDILPKARGQAQEVLRAAEAYREQRVIQAQGDASKFESVLAEYSKSKDVTRARLHLEVLERVLAKTDKILLDGQAGSNLLPFLPLRGNQPAASQPASQQPASGPAQQLDQPPPSAGGGQ